MSRRYVLPLESYAQCKPNIMSPLWSATSEFEAENRANRPSTVGTFRAAGTCQCKGSDVSDARFRPLYRPARMQQGMQRKTFEIGIIGLDSEDFEENTKI